MAPLPFWCPCVHTLFLFFYGSALALRPARSNDGASKCLIAKQWGSHRLVSHEYDLHNHVCHLYGLGGCRSSTVRTLLTLDKSCCLSAMAYNSDEEEMVPEGPVEVAQAIVAFLVPGIYFSALDTWLRTPTLSTVSCVFTPFL